MESNQMAKSVTDAPSALWAGERLRRTSYEALQFVREVGDTHEVARCLRNPNVLARGEEDTAAAQGIAEAQDWLVGALEYERLHGAESMTDKTHRFWIDVLEPARRIGQDMLCTMASTKAV